MMEKRPMDTSFNQKSFWSMNAMINKAYADKWGYRFTLAKPEAMLSSHVAESWYRVPWLQERLRSKNAACGWMLYMDSTAFVQNHQVSLSRYLDDLFKDQPMNLRTGGIFQWDARRSGMVSDKIFFIQANGHGEELMNAWRSSSSEDEAMSFEAAEQGTLTELLFPGKVATRSAKAMKLFQVSHAKIHVGSEQLRGEATVLFSAGTEGQCWGDFIQDTSLAPEAVKKKRSLEQLRRIGLVGARFNERLPALSAAMRGWKVPTWTAGMAGHQALISQKVKVQVKEENLEAEEKEILAELGESEE